MSLIILETSLSYSANTKGRLMTSFLNLQKVGFWLPWILQIENNRFLYIPIPDKSVLKGWGFWLPWIRQSQENNRTSLHNNTCQIRPERAHTTTQAFKF